MSSTAFDDKWPLDKRVMAILMRHLCWECCKHIPQLVPLLQNQMAAPPEFPSTSNVVGEEERSARKETP